MLTSLRLEHLLTLGWEGLHKGHNLIYLVICVESQNANAKDRSPAKHYQYKHLKAIDIMSLKVQNITVAIQHWMQN